MSSRSIRKDQQNAGDLKANSQIMETKKGRPKSPELPCVPSELEGSALLALVSILPDEVTNTPEERDHQKNGADSGEYHCIDEHGCLLLRLPVWDGFKLSVLTGEKLTWINGWQAGATGSGGILTQVKKRRGYGRRKRLGSRMRQELWGVQRFFGSPLDFFLVLPSGNTCSNTWRISLRRLSLRS